MIYDLPNPFMQVSTHGLCASQHAERLPSSDAAGPWADGEAAALEPQQNPSRGGVAAEPVGYRCCPDCGQCEPCDQHCPNAAPSRFQLDEAALMSELDPVPAFISRRRTAEEIEQLLELARAEEWPAPPRRMVG